MMRSLAELNREVSELQLQIRKLLLNNYNLDDEIADKLTVIATVAQLREKLVTVQREIRMKYPDAAGM